MSLLYANTTQYSLATLDSKCSHKFSANIFYSCWTYFSLMLLPVLYSVDRWIKNRGLYHCCSTVLCKFSNVFKWSLCKRKTVCSGLSVRLMPKQSQVVSCHTPMWWWLQEGIGSRCTCGGPGKSIPSGTLHCLPTGLHCVCSGVLNQDLLHRNKFHCSTQTRPALVERSHGGANRWEIRDGLHCDTQTTAKLHYIIITCHLADAFIQSDLQLFRLSRRHTPWSNVGLRALLKGASAVQI